LVRRREEERSENTSLVSSSGWLVFSDLSSSHPRGARGNRRADANPRVVSSCRPVVVIRVSARP
jgi:hypothetical protein